MAQLNLQQLAALVDGSVIGDGETVINSVNTLADADSGQISFLTNIKYKKQLSETNASAVIMNVKHAEDSPVPVLAHQNPHAAFARIAKQFDTTPAIAFGISDSAVIAKTAKIGVGVSIGHNVVIGERVEIGEDTQIGANTVIGDGVKLGTACKIYPNVTLYHRITLGDRVVVHSQACIGADGFGFANEGGKWISIPQIGGVVIGDDTSIGASSTIDRGAMTDTILGSHVIIDNQVQIGHNCVIGDGSCLCGCTGIAGSVTIGKNVIIAGHCGVNGHISIVDNVQLTGYTMVVSDITQPGLYSSNQPQLPNREWRRNVVRVRQLDDLYQRVKQLEKRLADKS